MPPTRTRVTDSIPDDATVPMAPRKEAALEAIGWVKLPIGLLAMGQQIQYGSEPTDPISPFALDLVAIEMHENNLADGLVALANNYPVLAALLDKVSLAGPMRGILGSVLLLSMQIAENHGKLPEFARSSPGVIDRHALAVKLRDEAQKQREQEAEEMINVMQNGAETS